MNSASLTEEQRHTLLKANQAQIGENAYDQAVFQFGEDGVIDYFLKTATNSTQSIEQSSPQQTSCWAPVLKLAGMPIAVISLFVYLWRTGWAKWGIVHGGANIPVSMFFNTQAKRIRGNERLSAILPLNGLAGYIIGSILLVISITGQLFY